MAKQKQFKARHMEQLRSMSKSRNRKPSRRNPHRDKDVVQWDDLYDGRYADREDSRDYRRQAEARRAVEHFFEERALQEILDDSPY